MIRVYEKDGSVVGDYNSIEEAQTELAEENGVSEEDALEEYYFATVSEWGLYRAVVIDADESNLDDAVCETYVSEECASGFLEGYMYATPYNPNDRTIVVPPDGDLIFVEG